MRCLLDRALRFSGPFYEAVLRRNRGVAPTYQRDLSPIEVRKAPLASVLRKSRSGVGLNEHMEHPEGAVVFQHACKMGWRELYRRG